MVMEKSVQLILFDGATGAGKSSALKHLRDKYSERVLVVGKLTTRPRRVSDNDWEFRFVTHIPERYSPYLFTSVGNQYAIDRDELLQAATQGFTSAISCVDRRTIEILKSDFPTVAIYIYRSWTADDLQALLAARGASHGLDAQLRRNEMDSIVTHYLQKIELYDHVLLNIGSKMDMIEQLSKILFSYGITSDAAQNRDGGGQ